MIVHHRIPQSTNISIVQTSYPYLQNYPNGGTECLYYALYWIWCIKSLSLLGIKKKLSRYDVIVIEDYYVGDEMSLSSRARAEVM